MPARSSHDPVRVRVDRGIYKRTTADGRTRYEIAFTDSDGRQRWRTADRLQEARDLRASLTTKVRSGERVTTSNATFGQFADQWLPKQTHLRPGTFALYESHLRTHLLPRFARRRLSAITVTDIASLLGEMGKGVRYVERDGVLVKTNRKPYKPWTVRAVLVVLDRVLGSAARDGLIPSNPCRRLEQRERPKASQRREFPKLDRDDIGKLIAGTPERLRCLLALSVLTGVRQGEALGLRLQDIDLREGLLRIRYQLDRNGELVEPKTPAARREIPLPPSLVAMLKTHKADAFALGHAKPTDYLFCSETGEPLARHVLRRGLDTALRASGLPRLCWHDLRHVSASVLIGEGASVAYLARILGHANPSITMAVYAHEFAAREHGDAMRDRMEAAFGRVLQP